MMRRWTRFPRGPRARLLLTTTLAALLPLAGCGKDKTTPPQGGPDVQPILSDVATGVILATYQEMDTRIGVLTGAVAALESAPTPERLATARQAWRAARVPWEASEAFLFGPVETLGLDPSLDSWPVNTIDLDNVMAGPQALTPQFVEELEGTLKGFHTTEYLLFGENGARTAEQLTARQLDYLVAVTAAMRSTSQRLVAAWAPGGGNFVAQLSEAGSGGSVYVSQKAALQELITGMAAIADEVANGKINDPFTAHDVTLEESRFSANSIADFQDNLRSVQNIYRGDYGGQAGHGVDEFVREGAPELDTRFAGEIQAAIDAIGAIPAPFTTAIFDHPAAVTAAQQAVRRVQQTLDEDIAPLLERFQGDR